MRVRLSGFSFKSFFFLPSAGLSVCLLLSIFLGTLAFFFILKNEPSLPLFRIIRMYVHTFLLLFNASRP